MGVHQYAGCYFCLLFLLWSVLRSRSSTLLTKVSKRLITGNLSPCNTEYIYSKNSKNGLSGPTHMEHMSSKLHYTLAYCWNRWCWYTCFSLKAAKNAFAYKGSYLDPLQSLVLQVEGIHKQKFIIIQYNLQQFIKSCLDGFWCHHYCTASTASSIMKN